MDPTKPKELYTGKRASGVDVSDASIVEAWNQVRSDEDPVNFVVLKQLDASTKIGVKLVGSGGAEELLTTLSDDEILFIGLRALVDGSVKFYHMYFVGENVSGVKKGKASMFESGVFQVFEGAHGKIQFGDGVNTVSVEKIVEKIQHLSHASNVIV